MMVEEGSGVGRATSRRSSCLTLRERSRTSQFAIRRVEKTHGKNIPVGMTNELRNRLHGGHVLGVELLGQRYRRGRDVEDASLAVFASDKEVFTLCWVLGVEREVAELSVVEAGRSGEGVKDGHVLRGGEESARGRRREERKQAYDSVDGEVGAADDDELATVGVPSNKVTLCKSNKSQRGSPELKRRPVTHHFRPS